MKVIGTGAPRMLTIRVEAGEVDVLRDELHHRQLVAVDAAAHALSKSKPPGTDDRELEECNNELVLTAKLLGELSRPVPEGQSLEVVGPTWLLAPAIRGAAAFAAERLLDAVASFGADTGSPTPAELRAARDAAFASITTLLGLHHAENHAVETEGPPRV